MTAATDFTLAELCIVAASQAFANEGEVLATGICVVPRLAASLAMKTSNPDLMMTDSEAWMLSDRFGQSNTSALGGTYEKPKTMMLGARGFPGNSISHPNSFFVPSHNTRVFMDGECDFVSSIGYNPARLPKGHTLDDVDIRLVITNLCVMDFGGPDHQIRLVSLHPGVTVEEVQENTGYPVHIPAEVPETTAPTEEQLAVIAALDPHNQRAYQIKDNPPGIRS